MGCLRKAYRLWVHSAVSLELQGPRTAMSPVLQKALSLHRAGQWAGAARLYQSILAEKPDDPDALYLLGVVHHQQGQHARAAELIGRACTLQPSTALFHADLAEAYRGLGQLERAVGCCQTALRLRPDFPEALCNLGLALQELGRNAEAAEHLRRSLRLQPDSATTHNALGLALRGLNRPEEALAHFLRAAELAPDRLPARANLSRLLLEMGRPAEALPSCREALRLGPEVPLLHHYLGNALRALGQLDEARAAYLEAVRLAPRFAEAHFDLGLLLHHQNRIREALPWLQKAAELDEHNVSFWVALAELYRDLEEQAAAIPCWERALALEPDRADSHVGLAWALQEEGRIPEALEHYRTALRLQPGLAIAQLGIGLVHEELGELAEAEAAFRAALRIQPDYALPHYRLAKLLAGQLPDADLAALEQRLTDPRLGTQLRTRLLFGLAKVLDGRGEYPRAAAISRQANALEVPRGRPPFDPAQHERFVDGLRHAFGPDFFARLAGTGLPTRRPVFVFGLPRSGTTLIEQVLASHPQVHGGGELRACQQTFAAIPAAVGRGEPLPDCMSHLDAAAVCRLAEGHLERLKALDGGRAERVVDKTPDNYHFLGLLATLFPQATFIHCRRDLRDVAVSCWLIDFNSLPWANHIEHIGTVFRQYLRLMEHWRKVLPVPIHEVAYEETVADLEGTARRLIAACGLDWHPACLEFHRTRRVVRTASQAQVRQPVYSKSVARWKHYEGLLDDLFAALPREEQ
jgi:tetratricopeptide (TPR) repeat protein